MILVYCLAIFVAAGLLFAVQPMTAKQLLPLLGGSPSVWTTCMLFFQAVLLGGYAYAHLLTTRVGRRGQLVAHSVLVLAGLWAGWWALGYESQPPTDASPIPWVLLTLGLIVGPAFFALSSAGPLLQRWFSATGHRRSGDPYFLYAASNAGSMLGLLSYPFLIEPSLALGAQRRVWLAGFVLFALLVVVCGALMVRTRANAGAPADKPNPVPVPAPPAAGAVPARSLALERLGWVALAFIPSSLLLGVTTYISTDVAAIPLLWVLPLALYLLSFIIAFGVRADRLAARLRYPAAVGIVIAALLVLFYIEGVVGVSIALHLAAFMLAATYCHASLAARRPGVQRLTEYYLLLSVGGALGGLFNAILAPAIFPDAYEYPLALILAAGALPWIGGVTGLGGRAGAIRLSSLVRFAPPIALSVYTVLIVALYPVQDASSGVGAFVVLVGVPAAIALLASRDGLSLALCLLAIAGVRITRQLTDPQIRFIDRTFFGVHRVVTGEEQFVTIDRDTGLATEYPVFSLYHGSTRHGDQVVHPYLSRRPSTYFHPSGPLGDVFAALHERDEPLRIGILGLGAGSMAAYGRPGDHITYFEIDPLVVHIARDAGHFTYLRDTPARVDVELGDGRLRLAEHDDAEFDLLIFDAFTGDAVPVHLISVEAIELYRRKVGPGGLVVMNVSNRRLDLAPIVANACAALGLHGVLRDDHEVSEYQLAEGKTPSTWTVLAGDLADLEPVAAQTPGWLLLTPVPGKPTWTDDFSSIIDVMIWRR